MATQALDTSIFAIDRRIEIEVLINGEILAAGIGQDGNLKQVDIQYDIEQMPPTCSLTMVTIPPWVKRGMDVSVNAGYNGELVRVFSGRVKRRRHGVQSHVIDCVGRTAKLTRPYRVIPKAFLSIAADDAIVDVLDDDGVNFTPAFNEQYDIDPAVGDWTVGTVQAAYLETMPPSDMIRKIADVDGNRIFETRAGTLRIRPLLEAPAPDPFRTYTTDGDDQSTQTTLTYDDTNINAASALGDASARQRRGQGFKVTVDGTVATVSMWVRKVGAPTDNLRLWVYGDNGSGLPSAVQLGGSGTFNGQLLDTVTYTKVTLSIVNSTPLVTGTQYHLVIERTGAVDAVNYYEVGFDNTPAYADGVSSVFNGTSWSSTAGDHPFEVVTTAFATLRILDIGDDEDEDQVKKKIIVRGATISSEDSEGNQIQEQVEQTAVTLVDDLAVGDPEFYAMVYQNDLIQDDIKAAEVALRLLDKYHRILENIEVEVPFDPRMDLGTTIGINDPAVTAKTGNWWVRGYRHTLSPSAASTQMSLFGGDQSGTTGLVNPRADFNFTLERELVGNAIQVCVTYDASASTDADGQIVNYRWQDDYAGGALDVQGPDLVRHTRCYNPATDSEINVTLTVTDDTGLTHSVTHTIQLGTNNEDVYAPVVSCAAGNTCMATFDGGQSWKDISTPSGLAKKTAINYDPNDVDAQMICYFGTTTGRIYRSTDGMTSLSLVYTDADGDEITGFGVDTVRRGLMWATTTDRVLLSLDYGATWSVYTDFNNSANWPIKGAGHVSPGTVDPRPIRIKNLLVADPSVNRIWIYGGRGDVVESWFHTNYLPDGGGKWYSEVTQGAGVAAQPRGANETVVDVVVSHRTSGDLGLMFADTTGGTPSNPYIYSEDYVPIASAGWQFGAGAMIGVNTDGVGIAANNNQLKVFGAVLDNKTFYVSQDGRSFWPIPNVLPGTAGNRPHHLLQVSAWKDIYLAAMDEGIAKSTNFGVTWAFFRPQGAPINTTWPAGAIGWHVAIEYRRPRAFQVMASVFDATAVKTATLLRNGTGAWVKQSEDAANFSGTCKIYSFPGLGNTIFRVRSTGSTHEGAWQTLQRSTDLGVTWTDTSVTNCADITRAANGHLFALAGGGDSQAHRIYRSTDSGATWTEVKNDTVQAGGAFTRYRRIEADPNNANRVMAVGWREEVFGQTTQQVFLISLDATLGASATYTRTLPSMTTNAEKTNMAMAIGQNGRIFVAYENFAGQEVLVDTSDNDGLTWTNRLRRASSGNEPPRLMFRAAMDIYLMHAATGGILRSRNNGLTWESFTAAPTAVNVRGLAWDSVNDILYTGQTGQTNPTDPNTVLMMVPPSITGVWLDITSGISAATGFANHNRLCTEGLETLKG